MADTKDYGNRAPSADELSLEAGIRAACDAVTGASTGDAQREAFRRLAELVARRSPETVARLERERGIGP